MANVGYATLQVIPSLKGVHQTISRELGGGAAQVGAQAGRSIGQSMSSGIGSAVQSSMRTVYAALQGGAVAAGGFMAASLAKGWGRLTTIQDATSALTISLGDSAAAGGLLADVLDVVRGTPFNLDQFAAAAQRMAGMGIEAQKIPTYLTAIGEASATQGGRAGEFADRLSTVFGQIAAQGQVSLDNIWQISDTGVNALAILGNAFGVTTDEMKEMISAGAVPATVALDVLADGILNGSTGVNGATVALAGTMESLRGNMSGAVSGISSAMARLGATLIEPFSPAITAGANAFADALDVVGARAGDLLSGLADSAPTEALVDFLETVPDRVDRLIDSLSGIAPVASLAGGALAALGLDLANQMLGPFEKILPNGAKGFGALGAGIVAMALSIPEARAELLSLAEQALPLLLQLLGALEPVLQAVSDGLGQIMPAAVRAAGAALLSVADAAVLVVEALAPIAVALVEVATPAVVAGLDAIASVLENQGNLLVLVASGWVAVKGAALATAGWTALVGTLSTVGTALTTVRTAITGIAATRGISTLAASFGVLKASAAGMVSSIAGMAAAYAPIAILAGGIYGLTTALGDASRRADEMVDSLTDVEDAWDSRGLESSIAGLRAQQDALQDTYDSYKGLGGAAKAVFQALTPAENEAWDTAKAYQGARDAAAELEGQLYRLQLRTDAISATFGVTGSEAEALMRKLEIDPNRISVADTIGRIWEELSKGRAATSQTAPVIEALQAIGDEASSTAEKVDAFADALDGIFGIDQSMFDAQIAYVDALRGLGDAITSSGGSFDAWSAEGSAALQSVSGLLDATKDRASAAVSQMTADGVAWGDAVRMAAAGVTETREAIINMGMAAGASREEMEGLVDQVGLTPENIEMLLTLEGGEETTAALEELQTSADGLGAPVNIEVDAEQLDRPLGLSSALQQTLINISGTPAYVTLNGERFFPTSDQVTQWTNWYDDQTPNADALLNTGGAQLGFTSLSQWAAFYESLDPNTRAWLDATPAESRFGALMTTVNWYRLANPSTTARADTAGAEGALHHLARDRTATIRVQIAGAGINGFGSVDAADRAGQAMPRGNFAGNDFGRGQSVGGFSPQAVRLYVDGKEMSTAMYPHTVRLARDDRRAATR